MKICLIADATSVHTQRWASYFMQQGDDVHLITYEPPSNQIKGVELHVIKSVFNNMYLAFIPRHLKIYFLVRKINPDIVHAHFISKFGFHAAFLGFYPLVLSAWGDDILIIPYWSKLLWYFTKISLKRSDLIYAASKEIMKRITDNFEIPSENVKINIHGVNVAFFTPSHKRSDTDNLIVFSNRNFYPVYNVETLIDAIPLITLKNPNVRFWIMGKGPDEKKIKQHAKNIGANQYIDWIDWIDFKDMPAYLNSCDIYASTALSDGTPVSMLEAMACGLPCIMTNVGGVSEWIKDDLTGLLIQPKNPKKLADKIIELANNSEKRMMMGNNARNLVVKFANKPILMKDVKLDYTNLAKKYLKT